MLVDLNPYVFRLGPIGVHWYGLFMALSVLAGAIYFYRNGMRLGLDEDFLLNLAMVVVISGVVGARLLFVLANYPAWFVQDPLQVLRVYEGGLSWHGGLLGGFAAGWIYIRRKGKDINALADLTVPGLTIGYTIVRIGNIFNQEVLGRTTAFWFGRWPAQLVGSAIGLILLIRFFYLRGQNLPRGYQFWSFLFYHQLLRALVEETVRDNPLYLWKYTNPTLGLGVFTLTQLFTPPILLLAWWMMASTKKNLRVPK